MTPGFASVDSDRAIRTLMITIAVAVLSMMVGVIVTAASPVATLVIVSALVVQILVTLRLARRHAWARAAVLWTLAASGVSLAVLALPSSLGGPGLRNPFVWTSGPNAGIRTAQCILGWTAAGFVLTTTPMRPVTRVLFRMSPAHPLYAPAIVGTAVALGLVAAAVEYAGGPPALVMLQKGGSAGAVGTMPVSPTPLVLATLVVIVVTLFLCFIAVGAFTDRTLTAARHRLGLHWPGVRSLGPLVLGLGVIVVVSLLHSLAAGPLVELLGGHPTTPAETSALFSGASGLLAGGMLALTAGTTEEFMFRGVLQPQLGLLATSVLFAAAHGFQYRADALVVVLIIGMVLGTLRDRFGLVAAIVVHVVYDLIALAVLP